MFSEVRVNDVKMYDITQPLNEGTPLYTGDPPTIIRRVSDISEGDAFTLSAISMSAHAGTHIDAPIHFFPTGMAVDKIPLDVLIGEAQVADTSGVAAIEPAHLERAGLPANTCRLILKTASSFSHLTESAARWIVQHGIIIVGIDQMSVDSPASASLAAHRTLLEAGVIIVESLNLAQVSPGTYTLFCLPLKLTGCDGAPARVVLLEATS